MEEKVNSRSDINHMIVGSQDVKALYPSLLAIPSADIITEVFQDTDISIKGVKWDEVGKYLFINLKPEVIDNLGLREVVSRRVNVGGRCPGMTTAEVMGKLYREEEEEVPSLFHPPRRPPTEREQKVMLAQVIQVAVLAVLQNHTYQFNGEVRLQKDGGPIGLELAGAIARVVMLWWDRKFLSLAAINLIELYLYLRYIEDQNMAVKPLAAGTRWVVGPWRERIGGKMIIMDHLVEEDKLIPEDRRTMIELRRMGNSICPMIQLEEDFPSRHENILLPILDLEVQVQQVEQENQPSISKLYYFYYRKPMANWQVMQLLPCHPLSRGPA